MRAALLALLLGAGAAHADIGLNIYGLSYHFDRDKAKESATRPRRIQMPPTRTT